MTERREDRSEPWEALLTRANAGDRVAFVQFLTAVTPALRTVIRRRGQGLPSDQVEDILQEVLLAIHLKRHSWRPDAPLRPWLFALARYKVVDAYRRRGRALHLPIEDFEEALPDDRHPAPMSAHDVEVMLGQIDARSAALVRAVAIDGQTAEAVGVTFGLSSGAVRVAFHRAMKRLGRIAERMMK